MTLDGLDLFLFDLAGTTVRDDGYVLAAFEGVARERGLQVEREWLRSRMGRSKSEVFSELLEQSGAPTGEAPALVDAFEGHLTQIYRASPIAPTEGAQAAIAALEAADVRVGFTTGFPRVITDRILAATGWSARLSVASDEVPRGRPAPDLIHAAMRTAGVVDPGRVGAAGDTPSDLVAASRAGCGVVAGLGCGTHTLAELGGHQHTHLAAGPLDLVAQLRGARP